jgi:hypothetical protein
MKSLFVLTIFFFLTIVIIIAVAKTTTALVSPPVTMMSQMQLNQRLRRFEKKNLDALSDLRWCPDLTLPNGTIMYLNNTKVFDLHTVAENFHEYTGPTGDEFAGRYDVPISPCQARVNDPVHNVFDFVQISNNTEEYGPNVGITL